MLKGIRFFLAARKIEKAKKELVGAYLQIKVWSVGAGVSPPPAPPDSAFETNGFWKLLWLSFGPLPKKRKQQKEE